MNIEQISDPAGSAHSGARKVDISRGSHDGRVYSEWCRRPDDERYLSLDDLCDKVRERSLCSHSHIVQTKNIRISTSHDRDLKLHLNSRKTDELVTPTHWAFSQLASIAATPFAYLQKLPASLAANNLRYGLINSRVDEIKTLETLNDSIELRAATSLGYSRIYDYELVEEVQRFAGNGAGDTHWKVPGVMDWSTRTYNPDVEITRETTTLYASDRDVFLFLVDDRNPIEAGQLPDGSPDLFFRGFYCWNSEVGARSLGIASFYLRAVCQNRNLYGVEDFQEIRIRHSHDAAARFIHEVAPALQQFANSSPQKFVQGIESARKCIVTRNNEDCIKFLRKEGFSKSQSEKIIEHVLNDEGHPPESIFDFVQGITRFARDEPLQDVRVGIERRAKKLLDKVG